MPAVIIRSRVVSGEIDVLDNDAIQVEVTDEFPLEEESEISVGRVITPRIDPELLSDLLKRELANAPKHRP